MADVSVAILTGGNSSRFGQSKQLHEIEGKPLFMACYEKFLRLSDDVFLQGEFEGAGVDTREDLVTGKGPLGGIYSALKNARHERVLVIACDMPHIDSRILNLLLAHDAELVVPRWRNGYLEPLCSVYSKKHAREIEEMLEEGTLKISRLFQRVEGIKFPTIENWIESGLISAECFYNMNELRDPLG
ncbi:MAG: molybdenum cofactor guanylyltransferase [Thermoplasmata archaeon]